LIRIKSYAVKNVFLRKFIGKNPGNTRINHRISLNLIKRGYYQPARQPIVVIIKQFGVI